MTKQWVVYGIGYGCIGKAKDTYEKAEVVAKQHAADQRYSQYEIGIFELIAIAKSPVPDIEIVKVTA